jgi:4-hydroxybenzoate polyprenyltransferase
MSPPPTRLQVLLSLGRVSNLPTVWSNVMAALVLSQPPAGALGKLPALMLAMSAYYVAGMYLNDFFDRALDARERPERPIPRGLIAPRTVALVGGLLLASGLALLAAVSDGVAGPASGVALGFAIVIYDLWHKNNPLSPLLMGSCRVLVYLTCGLAAGGSWNRVLLAGAAVLLCHLIGLTYLAKHEASGRVGKPWPLAFLVIAPLHALVHGARHVAATVLALALGAAVYTAVARLRSGGPGAIPRAVGLLIAAIALVDALLIAAFDGGMIAWIAALAFPATLLLQRRIAGT